MTNDEIPKMGDYIRDRVTGFEGHVTATVRYLTGCNQVGVENKDNIGVDEIRWIDEQRVEVIRNDWTTADFLPEEPELPEIPETHDAHPTRSPGRRG